MAEQAYEIIWKSLTGMPAVDLVGKRYTFVNFTAAGTINTATAAGPAIGILNEPNKPGQPAQVFAAGISFVVLGGAVAAGQAVEVGADGKAVANTAGTPVGICVVGGVADDIGCVLLK